MGALFITGLVLYVVGWILTKRDQSRASAMSPAERERLGLLPIADAQFPVRGCLWSFVIACWALMFLWMAGSAIWPIQ